MDATNVLQSMLPLRASRSVRVTADFVAIWTSFLFVGEVRSAIALVMQSLFFTANF